MSRAAPLLAGGEVSPRRPRRGLAASGTTSLIWRPKTKTSQAKFLITGLPLIRQPEHTAVQQLIVRSAFNVAN